MSTRLPSIALIAAALAAPAAFAQATPDDLSLTFLDPTGTVLSTDTIEVWVRLTNNNPTETFSFDLNAARPWGFDPGLIPTEGHPDNPTPINPTPIPFDRYNYASQFTYSLCANDSFAYPSGCGNGPYSRVLPSNNNWASVSSLVLDPGAFVDVNLALLSPVGGDAPAGTYSLSFNGLGVQAVGEGEDPGNPGSMIEIRADIFSVGTCDGQSAQDCAFTRTVVSAVPEPATWLALLAGLGLVGGVARRHRPSALSR